MVSPTGINHGPAEAEESQAVAVLGVVRLRGRPELQKKFHRHLNIGTSSPNLQKNTQGKFSDLENPINSLQRTHTSFTTPQLRPLKMYNSSIWDYDDFPNEDFPNEDFPNHIFQNCKFPKLYFPEYIFPENNNPGKWPHTLARDLSLSLWAVSSREKWISLLQAGRFFKPLSLSLSLSHTHTSCAAVLARVPPPPSFSTLPNALLQI